MAARLPARAALRARPESAPRPLLHAVLLDHDPATRAYAAEIQFFAADRGLDVFLHTDTAPAGTGKSPQPLSAAFWPEIVRTSPAHFVVGVCAHGRLTGTVRARDTDAPLLLQDACDAAVAEWWARVGNVIKDTLVRNPNVVPPPHLDALLSTHASQKSIRKAVALLARTADASRDWLERCCSSPSENGFTRNGSPEHHMESGPGRGRMPACALPVSPLSSESSPTVSIPPGSNSNAERPPDHIQRSAVATSSASSLPSVGRPEGDTDFVNPALQATSSLHAIRAGLLSLQRCRARRRCAARVANSVSQALPNSRESSGNECMSSCMEYPAFRSGPSSRWLHHSNEWSARIIRGQLRARSVHRGLVIAFSVIANLPVAPGSAQAVNLSTHLPSEGHRQRLLRELNELLPRVEELGGRLCLSPTVTPPAVCSYPGSDCTLPPVAPALDDNAACPGNLRHKSVAQTPRRPRREGRPFAAIAAPWLTYVRSLDESDPSTSLAASMAGRAGQAAKIIADGGWRCALCRSANLRGAECCVACRASGVSPLIREACNSFDADVVSRLRRNLGSAFDRSAFPWIVLPPGFPQSNQRESLCAIIPNRKPSELSESIDGSGATARCELFGMESGLMLQPQRLPQLHVNSTDDHHLLQQPPHMQRILNDHPYPMRHVGVRHPELNSYAEINGPTLVVDGTESTPQHQSRLRLNRASSYMVKEHQGNCQPQLPFDLSEALYATSIDEGFSRIEVSGHSFASGDISGASNPSGARSIPGTHSPAQAALGSRNTEGVAAASRSSSSSSPVYLPGSSPAASPPGTFMGGTGSPILSGRFSEEIRGSAQLATIGAHGRSTASLQLSQDLASFSGVTHSNGLARHHIHFSEQDVDHAVSISTPIPVPVSQNHGSLLGGFRNGVGSDECDNSPSFDGANCGGQFGSSCGHHGSLAEDFGSRSIEGSNMFIIPPRKLSISLPVVVPGTTTSFSSNSGDTHGQASSLHALAAASDAANGGQGAATMESLATVSAMFTGTEGRPRNRRSDGGSDGRSYAMF